MNKEKMMEEIGEYCEDITGYLEQGDYSSAQKMVSGLRKAIPIWKREVNQYE